MSRNAESRFALNPTNIDIQRSRFNRNCSIKTSFNVGEVIPFYLDEVLPGSTFQVKTNKVVRMQTLITPVMDNIYLDTYYFYVPSRILWKHWKEFMGENTESAWIPQTEYTEPQIVSPAGGFAVGSIADYLGVPTGVAGLSMSALPFRAYAKIINEWFRDENLVDPLVVPDGDETLTGSNGTDYVTDIALGGKPFIAAKYHDYFTSCLPSPQKGPSVTIPVAEAGDLPVVTKNDRHAVGQFALRWTYGTNADGWVQSPGYTFAGSSGGGQISNGTSIGSGGKYLQPDNLWATFDGQATAATVNELRTAFQIQRWYEKAARGGSRYIETLKAHFGVTSPDSRLQRPEYLGGNRIPININQVIQQSGTVSGETPQGTTAAFSLTTDSHFDFTRSFTEHGWLIGLMVARYDHTYQQGLERMWSRKTLFDYYWPEFANLGEQAVLNKEIYAQPDSKIGVTGKPENEEVFGFQERYAEYRYKPSRVTAEMRSQYELSLDVWHLADYYNALPSLSAEWIREDKANVDRVLAVQSSVSNQFFADLYVQNRTTQPMPLYSIPGLIDHH